MKPYSNFHYVESVTTYGGPPPGLSGARTGSVLQNGYALVGFAFVLCGTTFAYFKEKKNVRAKLLAYEFQGGREGKARAPMAYLVSVLGDFSKRVSKDTSFEKGGGFGEVK